MWNVVPSLSPFFARCHKVTAKITEMYMLSNEWSFSCFLFPSSAKIHFQMGERGSPPAELGFNLHIHSATLGSSYFLVGDPFPGTTCELKTQRRSSIRAKIEDPLKSSNALYLI